MDVSTRNYSRMKVLVVRDAWQASLIVAEQILEGIQAAQVERGRAVLGLSTGSTPEPVYAHLVERHRTGLLSFQTITTYNLDEYYPISPLDHKSYRSYMHRHLFSQVDIVPHQAHVLDGTVPEAFAAEHAAQFDRWIAADGGLDLQLLGIGRNGHIGFNEPTDLSVEQALESADPRGRATPDHPRRRGPGFRWGRSRDPSGIDHGDCPDPGGPVDSVARHRRAQGRGRRLPPSTAQ